MTARSAATIASLVVLCGSLACTSFYEIPIETPIQPKMDVSGFQRVLVAGFIGGGTDDVDANLETVRLLRSQLRSKSSLRVVEAEVLPLAAHAISQTIGVPAARQTDSSRIPRTPTSSGSRTKKISNASRASSRMSRSGRSWARNTRIR